MPVSPIEQYMYMLYIYMTEEVKLTRLRVQMGNLGAICAFSLFARRTALYGTSLVSKCVRENGRATLAADGDLHSLPFFDVVLFSVCRAEV
jgi:hypothetical protein